MAPQGAPDAKMVSQNVKMEALSPLNGNPRSQNWPAPEGVALKINNIGVGARGHVHKYRNHENEGNLSSPKSKSKSYKTKSKQNNSPELLSLLFP